MPRVSDRPFFCLGVIAAVVLTAPTLGSQNAPPASAAAIGPAVDDPAPDFALAGATRYGVLRDPVRLSDFRGRTVVLAFFSQARTKG